MCVCGGGGGGKEAPGRENSLCPNTNVSEDSSPELSDVQVFFSTKRANRACELWQRRGQEAIRFGSQVLALGDLLLPLEAHTRTPPVKVQLAWTMEVSGFQPLAGLPVEFQDDGAGTTEEGIRERDREDAWILGGLAGSRGWERVLPALPSVAEFHCQRIVQTVTAVTTVIATTTRYCVPRVLGIFLYYFYNI